MSQHTSARSLTLVVGIVLAAASGAVASLPALAQGPESRPLEEIIVTASRREEKLQDAGLSVSVVDTRALADAGLTGLPEILQFVPGVSVVDSGAPFNSSVFIRGINSVLSAGVVSYVDDIPFGSSTVYSNPTPLDGTLLDLSSLDVLKGPQGTLYGSSAIGGILKYNSRQASLDAWSGSATVDLSSTEGGGLNQLYRASVNGPIATDRLGLSLTGFWRDKTGYIDNEVLGTDNWDDYEYYGGSVALRWAVTERMEVRLQGLYQNSTQNGFAQIQANHADGQLRPGIGTGEPWFGEYATGQADLNPSEYKAEVYGLFVDYDFGFARLASVTSYQEMSFEQSTDVTVPFAAFADLFFPQNAPHTSAIFVGEQGFEKFTQELRLTSPSGQRFEWIAGAYYSDEDSFNGQRLDISPPEPLYAASFPSNFEEFALFATGTWYFRPDLDASIGVRYTDYSNDVELTAVGPLIGPLPYNEIEDDVTTFLFNLRYRPSEAVSYYARIASGFRPGGANLVLLNPGTGQPINDPLFESDSLWSYELGVKGSTADGRFGYELAGYYIDWQDYIIPVTRGGLTVAGNAEEAVSMGLEGSLNWAVTDALMLRAMASYVNAELTADSPDLGGADGDQLPNTPEWQAALDAEYRFRLGGLPAFVGAAWRYKGEMPVGFEGYTDANGNVFPPSAPRVDIDSYSLVDLRAGLKAGPVDVSVYLTNVFDEWGYTNFTPSFVSASLGTPTRPRTYGAVVRWSF
jgi:outer membrane receptor protein involved in Fe transport